MKNYSPWHNWNVFPDQNLEAMVGSETSGKKGTLSSILLARFEFQIQILVTYKQIEILS